MGLFCVRHTKQPWCKYKWTRRDTIPPILLLSILQPCPSLRWHGRRWPSALLRRVAAHTVPCPLKGRTCQMCGLAKICSTLNPLPLWRKGSYHGAARSCPFSIPSDLSSPSTFPVLWCLAAWDDHHSPFRVCHPKHVSKFFLSRL